MKIAVQLYTLRDTFAQDVWGTFDKLAEIGFKNIELAGKYDLSHQEFAEGLKARGLTVTSDHVGLTDLESDPAAAIEMAKTFGHNTLVIPWLSIKDFPGGWEEVGKRTQAIAENVVPKGMNLLYHNHDFEFEMVGDKTGHEVLFAQTNPTQVGAELDLYWVKKGGQDPVTLINHFNGRLPVVHFKDMNPDTQAFTEVGSGSLDWDAIIPAAKAAGAKYAVIENDQPQMDPLESVRISREFLLSKGLQD